MAETRKKNSKTYCPAPFNSVTVTATGRWALCCDSVVDYTFDGGHKNIKDSGTVWDWFGSDYMKSVRGAMLEGRPLKECATCYKAESMGVKSYRQMKIEDDTPDTSRPKIKFMDIKFGNKCNLKCKMCFPHSSSELMKEWWDLGWTVDDPMEGQRTDYYDGYMLENYDWPRQQENIDKLLDIADGVKVLKFTGGEPMINPQMFKFISHCVKRGIADSMVLYVTTNCTKIHPRFLELASKFKQLNLRLSIDGHGPTYDYVRYPANWETVFNNVKQYSAWYKEGLVRGDISFNAVASVFNVHQMPSLVRLLRPYSHMIMIDDLARPMFMGWRHAPEAVIRDTIRQSLSMISDHDPVVSHHGKELAAMFQRKNAVATEHSHQQLREFVNKQDTLRGIHIRDYIPHLEDTIG